ncbi:extracellular solute-binding protein family 5 [Beutenbergia cavernae DSM 12333]|uniref:Extracellular solute-binding protein family 5 n=1 Tax=Beutenbergia cavernae (strain ATCC BAA-8 / DSM 12333 / CCUG 43141 / JCM 11478 / NBRC 16432 / NCIMB 13614 / HKI 0122) TaxID=471853 RepID=C5BX57_BEUC1|nr:ABC transporter substrate-binding protein [Beutenbergia cavernae]ACQ78732.1 extracellular solute-binding protein family 5 [Beutenbergia cavernae DSM 12333]
MPRSTTRSVVPSALNRRGFLLGTASVAGAGVLTACAGGGGEPGSSGSTASGEPTTGGTLTVAFPADPENLDPHQRPQLYPRTITRQIADSLTDQDPETGEVIPWLASSWEISDDVRTFTFTLRDDVTFSDGTPLTADVVTANWERILEIGPLAYVAAGLLRDYSSSEVIDSHTVSITFANPNAQFLQATASQSLAVLAPATLALTPEEVAAGDVIGSGPYILESYTPGEDVVLTVREDYAWGSPLYANRGRGYVDRIEFSIIPEPTTMAGAVASGQIDFAYLLDVSVLSTVESSDAELIGTDMPAIAIPIVPLVYRPIFADERTRRALSLATDREAIVDSVFEGRYQPASAVLTKANPGWVDLSDQLAYDVDGAIALLEEAGWTTVGDDGLRSNDAGEPLRFEIQYTSAGTSSELMLQLLQQQWRAVGADFVLTPVSTPSEANLHEYPFDITTWSQTRADADVLRTVYSSFFENQSFLFDNADPELDGLLTELQTTVDAAARLEVSGEAQRLIVERGYSIPLYDLTQFSAASSATSGAHADIEGKPVLVDIWKP